MNSQNVFDSNPKSRPDAVRNAEETLRLIASLPAPQGLEDRMIEGLRSAPRQGRVLSWPGLASSSRDWLRTAAAATIAFVIVGGGWGVYSHVQPGNATATVPRPAMGGGFSNAGAVRVPETLPAPQAVQPAPVNQNLVDLDKANHKATKQDETSLIKKDHEKAAVKSEQHKKLDAVKKPSAQPAPSVAR